jgi:hypothetical protein
LFIYLISGLFLRRTELVTLRFLNNNKNPREIFLDIRSNLFIINIYYYKGQGFSKKKTFNIRYLYSVVSCIFLLYIVLVDLFIEFLNINNSLLDSKVLSYFLIFLSNRFLGLKLNIQVYYQLIINIIEEFILEKLNLDTLFPEEDENTLNKLVVSQSNHSTSIKDYLFYYSIPAIFKRVKCTLQESRTGHILDFSVVLRLVLQHKTAASRN